MDGALAAQIQAGKRLRKAQTNDRSAPIVATDSTSGVGARPGAGLASAPRPPGFKGSNGAPKPPKNTSNNASYSGSATPGPPQLGGLFAGGMPTLKKTSTNPPASTLKSAPAPPKPPVALPPSRAPPPTPPVAPTPSRLPPPVPPQTTSLTRPPPPPPVASSRPPPPLPPQANSQSYSNSQIVSSQSSQNPLGLSIPSHANLRPTKSLALLSPQQGRPPPPPPNRPLAQQASSLVRTASVGLQSRADPPAPPPRPHTSHAIQPPPLPSRPGARAAPPPPPPRTTNNSPNLGGSLNRKAPPPPPRPFLPGSTTTSPEIHPIERSASTPPRPGPPPPPQHSSLLSNVNHPSQPARLPPPVSRLQQSLAPNFPSNTTRPMSMAPSPPSAIPAHTSLMMNRNRVLSTPTPPEDTGIFHSSVNGSPRTRPKSMIVAGTLASSTNRPPSPPTTFSINPPRNFPPSNTFPPPRKFQSGITHQYPSSKKQGCEWDYKAVLA